MHRVRSLLPYGGHQATRIFRYGAQHVEFLSGENAYKNIRARIPPSISARQSLGSVLRTADVELVSLDEDDTDGVIMPSSCTQLGYSITKIIGKRYYQMLSKQVRDFDGSLDTLAPYDFIGHNEREMAGGILTPRMFYNLISSMPITQQQAALNTAILTFYAKNRNNPVAELANIIACDVGDRWNILPSATPALMGMNSLSSSTGLVHLYEDVPNSIVKYLKKSLGGKITTEEALEMVYMSGSACELAKQAALGALGGTQYYMDEMQENLPLLQTNVPYCENFRLAAGRKFFTAPFVEGAIDTRDTYIFNGMQSLFATHGIVIERSKLKTVFDDGAKKSKSDAQQVKEIAEQTSTALASGNIEAAEDQAQ